MRSSHKQDKYTLEQSYALLYESYKRAALLYEARDSQPQSDEQRISNLLNEIIKQVEEQLLPISKGDIGSKVEGIIDDLISLQADVDDRSALRGARYSDGIIQDDAGDSQERVDVNHYIKKMRRYKFTDAHWITKILDDHLLEMDPDEDPIGFLQSIARHLKDEEFTGMSDEKIQELTGVNPQEIGELDSGSRIGPRYSDGPQFP